MLRTDIQLRQQLTAGWNTFADQKTYRQKCGVDRRCDSYVNLAVLYVSTHRREWVHSFLTASCGKVSAKNTEKSFHMRSKLWSLIQEKRVRMFPTHDKSDIILSYLYDPPLLQSWVCSLADVTTSKLLERIIGYRLLKHYPPTRLGGYRFQCQGVHFLRITHAQ